MTGVGLLALHTLFGFFGVPLLIERVGIDMATDRLNGAASLEDARFNPFTFRLELTGLEVTDVEGARVASFAQFVGNFDPLATIFLGGYRFHRATVSEPYGSVVISEDGRLNLAELPAPSEDAERESEPLKRIPRVVFEHLGMDNAALEFTDLSQPEPVRAEVHDLTFRLDGLDTKPEEENQLRLVAETPAGERFVWEGTLFVDPLTTRGTLTVENLDVPRFMPYGIQHTTARLVGGRLDMELDYDFAPVRRPRAARVHIGRLALSDVAIEQAGDSMLRCDALRLSEIAADADARTISIDSIGVESPRIDVLREEGGDFRLTRLLAERDRAMAEAGDSSEAMSEWEARLNRDVQAIEYPIEQLLIAIQQLSAHALGEWAASIREVTVLDGDVRYVDRSTWPMTTVSLSAIELSAGPIASVEEYRTPFDLRAKVGEAGRLELVGAAMPVRRLFEGAIDAEGIELGDARAYLPSRLSPDLPPASLESATLGMNGSVSADLGAPGRIGAEWSGDLSLSEARLGSAEQEEALAALERLALSGDARITLEGGDRIRLEWDGSSELAGAQASASLAGPVSARAGLLGAVGTLEVRAQADAAPTIVYRGNASAQDVQLRAPERRSLEFALARASVAGALFESGTPVLEIESLDLEGPDIAAALALIPSESSEPGSTEAPATRTEGSAADLEVELPIGVRIASFNLSKGRIKLTDPNADPPATLLAEDLSVEASDIASDGASSARFAVTSRVQNSGSIQLTGSANAFQSPPQADVELTISTLPLKPYDAFSGWYIGHLIERGRLDVTLPMTLQEGRLDGKLNARLDQFYLGEGVPSPAAPDVPVKLGLALLRDGQGVIDVGVPISGDMSDPEFSVGGVVWQAFTNLIVGAATSPFKILGSIFAGGSDVDLSQVAFDAGADQLTSEGLSKVDALARAMKERPGLSLSISGRYSMADDEPILREDALRQEMLKRLRDWDPGIRTMEPHQYRRAIRAEYQSLVERGVMEPVRAQGDESLDEDKLFARKEEAVREEVGTPTSALIDLARRRAEAVRSALVNDNGVEPARVSVDPVDDPSDKSPLVVFDLGRASSG